MKKRLALALAGAFIMVAGTVCAAAQPTPLEKQEQELAVLKERLAAMEQEMQAQKLQLRRQELRQQKAETGRKDASGLDDLKFYGDARIRSIDSGDGYSFEQRVRLNLEKKLSKDALFRIRGIFMNENELGTTGTKDRESKIDNAYIEVKNLYGDRNTKFKAGRFGHSFGKTGYWSSAGSLGMYDGFELTTGNKLKVSLGFGDWGGAKDPVEKTDKKGTTANRIEENVFLKLGYDTSAATSWQAWYIRETSADESPKDYEVSGLGVKSRLSDKFTLAADYSRNAAISDKPEGKFMTLTYGRAQYAKPHSWETRLYYADVDKGNVPGTLNKSINIPCNDVKGPGFSIHYTVLKNVMAEFLTGFNMEKKSTGIDKDDYYRFQISAKI